MKSGWRLHSDLQLVIFPLFSTIDSETEFGLLLFGLTFCFCLFYLFAF